MVAPHCLSALSQSIYEKVLSVSDWF